MREIYIEALKVEEHFDKNFVFKKDIDVDYIFEIHNVKTFKGKNGNWYYKIDVDNFNINNFKSEFKGKYSRELEEFEKRFNEKTTIQIKDLSLFMNDVNYNPSQIYSIEADVETCNKWNDVYYCKCMLIEYNRTDIETKILNNQNVQKITLKIEEKYIPKNMSLKDKHIRATGIIKFHQNDFSFRFCPTKEVDIISKSIRKMEFERNLELCREYNWVKEENDNPPDAKKFLEDLKTKGITLKNIGLISNKSADGYGDFEKFRKNYNIVFKNTILNTSDVIKAIEEFNEENDCQILCILRGGGNGLNIFDDIRLAQTIALSPIPIIITAVGHATDKSLCDYVADYDAITPTNVAKFINRLMWITNHPHEKTREELEFEIFELQEELEEKQKEINELRKKSKGFFSSIFGD